MSTFLSNLIEKKTPAVASGDKLTVDVDAKPSMGTPRLSFTTVPATPPETSQDISLTSTTQAENKINHEDVPTSTDSSEVQSEAKPQDILPTLTTQLDGEAKPHDILPTLTTQLDGSKPQDILPITATQLGGEAKPLDLLPSLKTQLDGEEMPQDILPTLTTELDSEAKPQDILSITATQLGGEAKPLDLLPSLKTQLDGEEMPQDILPTLTTQLDSEAKPQDILSISATQLDGGAKPPDILPISTAQLDNESSYEAVPAHTDGYQDSIQTSQTNVAPKATHSLSPATRLKHKLQHTRDLIVCPGVYDGLSARIAQAVGFETLYMTGAGTTASMLGMADLGIASRNEMVRNADMIANLDSHHFELIADMDTGYGGPVTIAQTVKQYTRANVAAFHIEDQVLTKRCGHLSGKKVVTNDVYLTRIRAAREAIDYAQADIQLIARTDANQQLGYDECMVRLKAARDCGADVGLLEGFKSKEEAAKAVKELAPWPLLLNIVENGHSPLITVDEAREMGFRIMIFSFAGLAPAYMAIKGAYEKLRHEGITGIQGSGVGPRVLFDVCGLQDSVAVDVHAGGEDYKGMT